MAAPQVPAAFPPEAQAVIARLQQELNERNQQVAQLQQALSEKSQLVLERDLQVIQLQAQATHRTHLQVPMAQVGQIHKAVTAVQDTMTEIHGMMVTRNTAASNAGGVGSLAASNAESRDVGPFPVELWTRVLGFLPYSDVCRMERVATVFREDVINTLKTIYIDDKGALFHHRFYYGRNVQEVVFACVFEEFQDAVGDEPGRFTFETWIRSYSWKLSSFVSNFRKLKYVFFAKGNEETKQEILSRLSLQGDVEAGYDYIYSIPRGHINFVQPRVDDDDDDDDIVRNPVWILEQLANGFFFDPILNPTLPVRMVYGLPRVHRGDSCLGGGCTHEGSKHVPRVESKVHPGMFLPC